MGDDEIVAELIVVGSTFSGDLTEFALFPQTHEARERLARALPIPAFVLVRGSVHSNRSLRLNSLCHHQSRPALRLHFVFDVIHQRAYQKHSQPSNLRIVACLDAFEFWCATVTADRDTELVRRRFPTDIDVLYSFRTLDATGTRFGNCKFQVIDLIDRETHAAADCCCSQARDGNPFSARRYPELDAA